MFGKRNFPFFKLDSLQLKYFSALSLPILAALFILIAGYSFLETRSRTEILKADSLTHIDSFSELFTRTLSETAADLVTLAESHLISSFLAAPGDSARAGLAQDLSAVVTAKPGLDQARIISLEGRELLRINLRDGRPYPVDREELQDKSDRYYVQEALKLGRDQIYISRFDLNIEHGLIERPYKPMIRFAAALFDDQGRKKGLLVLNYLGGQLLDLLRVVSKAAPGRVMFINKEGYWLSGVEPERLWGFMFPDKKDMTFGRFFPQAWKIIAAGKEGQFISEEGLFTFTTISPLEIKAFRYVTREVRLLESRPASSSPAGQFKVIHHISKEELAGLVGLSFHRLALLWGTMGLAVVLIAWFTAQAMAARKRTQEDLVRKNAEFEAVFQANPEGVIFEDLRRRMVMVNPAITQLFGYPPEELIGQSARLLYQDPRDFDEQGRLRFNPEAEEIFHPYEMKYRRKDGGSFLGETIGTPVKDRIGRTVGLLVIMRDITERKRAEEELRQSELTLNKAQDIARLGNWTLDIATNEVSWSKALCRLLEVNPEDLGATYETFLSFVHPNDREMVRLALAEAIFEEKPFDLEHRLLRAGGRELVVHAQAEIIFDERGGPVRLIGTVQDITERKESEKELRIKDSAIQSSINAIVMTDLEGRITYVNHSALAMFGYEEKNEVLGIFAAGYFKDPGLGPKILKEIMLESSWIGESEVLRKDGSEITVRIAANLVKDENGRPYCLMGSMIDISEQKKAEEMLRFQARHDALTGLYNRRHLMERLETEVGAARRHGFPLAVCMCDLDHFKAVNDTYGHRTGDQVLARFGRLIAEEVRAQDTAGRYGGEEFFIIFPYTSASAAHISLERIRIRWEKTIFEAEDGRKFGVTASFGLAQIEAQDINPNDLLEKADQALYQAKESGRNRVVGPRGGKAGSAVG